ncbi:hypothetical protein V6N11_016556 [Hibiscus sabdariffa]|uniref:RNase H type-1 domain-containing protein n=1 Tax=Hibiscus sabdariffa TaxID=183260 RepID=A0ABR2TVA6_9ROSI
MRFCKLLGVATVLHRDPKVFLQAWNATAKACNAEWVCYIPSIVIWTVWLFRNDVIFKGNDVDWIQVDFLVKFRIASWLLAKFPNDSISVESLMADFSLAINLIHYVNRGNSKSGIGGLLRDESGMILMEFSEASSLSLPALVELEAINFGISNFFYNILVIDS